MSHVLDRYKKENNEDILNWREEDKRWIFNSYGQINANLLIPEITSETFKLTDIVLYALIKDTTPNICKNQNKSLKNCLIEANYKISDNDFVAVVK